MVAPGRDRGGTLNAVRPVHDVLAGLSRSYLFEDLTAEQLGPLRERRDARARSYATNVCATRATGPKSFGSYCPAS